MTPALDSHMPSSPRPRAKLPSSVLVLNADYQPLSLFPLSLCSWQDAVKAVMLESVEVVCNYDDAYVRSPSFTMPVPSVIALRDHVNTDKRRVPFTRFNVFLRDDFSCQYCGDSDCRLTFDHVTPRSKGGGTNWENVATACEPCNLRKGNKELDKRPLNHPTTGMRLARRPHEPTRRELNRIGRMYPPHHLHESWLDYVYWDVELDMDVREESKLQPKRVLGLVAADGITELAPA